MYCTSDGRQKNRMKELAYLSLPCRLSTVIIIIIRLVDIIYYEVCPFVKILSI